jgi:uncharacterized protein
MSEVECYVIEGRTIMSQIKVEKPSEDQRKEINIPDTPQNSDQWSVWECEPSTFDWHYDQTEVAYVYEGKVTVKISQGEVEINRGDLVTFPKGLDCTWNVIEKVRKVYQFK